MGQVEQQIAEIQPYVQAIRDNPELIDQINRGTRPSRSTPQPEDDQEARDTAEDLGLYTADNRLDIARARRILDRAVSNAEKKLEGRLRRTEQTTVQAQADVMRQRLYTLKDKDGVTPMASRESMDEMLKVLPAELVAQPNVAFFVALAAAGFDKYNGRRPQVVEPEDFGDPLHTEPTGRRSVGIHPELQQIGRGLGLTDADLKSAAARPASRRGIPLE
jgi:hypothetical protein